MADAASTPAVAHCSSPSTSFACRRVNESTILIIEDDEYGEEPHIYVKVYSNHLVIADTGCNTPRLKKTSMFSLREYLETFLLPLNNHQALNPDGKKQYIIICSHCHYDHIPRGGWKLDPVHVVT